MVLDSRCRLMTFLGNYENRRDLIIGASGLLFMIYVFGILITDKSVLDKSSIPESSNMGHNAKISDYYQHRDENVNTNTSQSAEYASCMLISGSCYIAINFELHLFLRVN